MTEKKKLSALLLSVLSLAACGSSHPAIIVPPAPPAIVAPVVTPTPPSSQFQFVTDSSIHLAPPLPMPAKGQSYIDPVFGTTITRITDARATISASLKGTAPVLESKSANGNSFLTWIGPEYSTTRSLNIDNSFLILVHGSYYGLYDGKGVYLRDLPFEISASSEPRWSRTLPYRLYYHIGNILKTCDVSTAMLVMPLAVVHTFTEYAGITGKGKTDLSYDGDHLLLIGDSRELFLYEISTGIKSVIAENTDPGWNNVFLGPANEPIISWLTAGSGRGQGVELYDRQGNFVRQLTHADGHSKTVRDTNGDSLFIWTNSADPNPTCGFNAIVKVRLVDGVQTCLLSIDWSEAIDATAGPSGWVYIGTYHNPITSPVWAPYADEIIRIKLDGSEIQRLAHHRSEAIYYDSQPHLTVSDDGMMVLYGSNWAIVSDSVYCDTYLLFIAH